MSHSRYRSRPVSPVAPRGIAPFWNMSPGPYLSGVVSAPGRFLPGTGAWWDARLCLHVLARPWFSRPEVGCDGIPPGTARFGTSVGRFLGRLLGSVWLVLAPLCGGPVAHRGKMGWTSSPGVAPQTNDTSALAPTLVPPVMSHLGGKEDVSGEGARG